jgi:hypothetical protein
MAAAAACQPPAAFSRDHRTSDRASHVATRSTPPINTLAAALTLFWAPAPRRSLLPFPPTAARVFGFLAVRAHVVRLADSQTLKDVSCLLRLRPHSSRCCTLISYAHRRCTRRSPATAAQALPSKPVASPLSKLELHKRYVDTRFPYTGPAVPVGDWVRSSASCPQSCARQRSQHLLPGPAARPDRSGERQGV